MNRGKGNMDIYNASAHHTYMQLNGDIKENWREAKEIACKYFVQEVGREPSFAEREGLEVSLYRLVDEKNNIEKRKERERKMKSAEEYKKKHDGE